METTPEEALPPGQLLLLHSASFLVLDLALGIHPLPLGGFADYPHASFSWRPFPNISQIPLWSLHVNPHLEHACPCSQCAPLILPHLLLLVGFKLLGHILWELK